MPSPTIRRALIAVYDKTGIVEFARALVEEFGVELLSTGGTARHLQQAGLPVTLVEQVTGFPEMLDGRVKTLHPHIHAAILADRDNPEHMRQIAAHGIRPIDLVVVNLYPFEQTIADPNCRFEDAVEMIDIGGPCLLRAAAKNHKHVIVVSDAGYDRVLNQLRNAGDEAARRDLHERGAIGAFDTTAGYDARVANWLSERIGSRKAIRHTRHSIRGSLRYGENPHQSAELLGSTPAASGPNLTNAEAGVPDQENWQQRISYNNYLDADAALGLCAELTRAMNPVWHRFPTGAPSAPFQLYAENSERSVTTEQHHRRNLPHIQRPQATYFVTFRLRSGQLATAERTIVLDACRHWHGRKMTLHAAVVMPDHVHLLLTPHETRPGEWTSLSELMHSIKRYAANAINQARSATGAVWMDEYFDRLLRNKNEFLEKWNYVEANPVTAGLSKPGEYPWFWSSNTQFMETVEADAEERHRLETGGTEHRLETGATGPVDRMEGGSGKIKAVSSAACLFIKHNNPCGVGVSNDPLEAYRRAYLGDANAAMGGVLACNFEVSPDFADAVMNTYDRLGKAAGAGGFFVEVWIAPAFDAEAVRLIRSAKKWGENIRLLAAGDMSRPPDPAQLLYRSIAGGLLVQSPDLLGLDEDSWKVVTKRLPDDREMADLRLAWLVAKHTKSNAISLCRDGMLLGNGAGQMSRVMSCRLATWLAKENGHAAALAGAVAASDAFFPFRDGPELLLDAGVTAIIQPGGSKRDAETIAACDERGVAMIFTAARHFRH